MLISSILTFLSNLHNRIQYTHRFKSEFAHDLAGLLLPSRLLRLGDQVDARDGVGDAAGAGGSWGRLGDCRL